MQLPCTKRIFKTNKTLYGDVKYSIGNSVNNIIITMFAVRGVLDLLGGHFISYVSMLCT